MRGGCQLVYVDVGSNNGESIADFVAGRAEGRVQYAVDDVTRGWHGGAKRKGDSHRMCVYAFEPNRRFTEVLQRIGARAAPHLHSILIYNETAAVGTQDRYVTLGLAANDPRGVGSSVGSVASSSTSSNGNTVRAINLVDWLRNTIVPSHPLAPIVMRLDIEGAEYAVLRDMIVRGLSASISNPLYIGVEWHRYRKRGWPTELLDSLARQDARFEYLNEATLFRLSCLNRPHRPKAKDPCTEWFDKTAQDAQTRALTSENARAMASLFENYEKMLIHFLLAANVTWCDNDRCVRSNDLPPVVRRPSARMVIKSRAPSKAAYEWYVQRRGQASVASFANHNETSRPSTRRQTAATRIR